MEEKERQKREEEEESSSSITSDRAWSWGAGTDGQLATTKLQDENFPQPVQIHSFAATPITHLACGGAHVIALSKVDGKVLTWGRGTSGQLGHGDTSNCLYPLPVKSLERFVITHVSAGWNHSGFVSNVGRVFTCGDGSFGQLGHGDYESQCIPTEVSYLGSKHVEQIACGMRHTLVLIEGSSGNQIYGFGSGKRGQLVPKVIIRKSLNLPQVISGFEDVVINTIVANGDQSAALTVDRHIYTWGRGFCSKSDARHPDLFSSSLRFTQVALGWNHALLLTEYGEVYMLGGNHHGILSDPQKMSLNKCSSNQTNESQSSEDNSTAPTLREVPDLRGINIVDIAAGSEHSAIVTESGNIMTWGWGEHGQLGLGNEEDQTAPQVVTIGTKITTHPTHYSIYCGSGFTFAIERGPSTSQI